MAEHKVYTAIGLMSGTSLDGEIDVALLRTDGRDFVERVDFKPFPYDISARDKVRACFGKRERDQETDEAEQLVTDLHIEAVKASGFQADVIGFHGQTITHDPDKGFTWQLGDGERLAQETGMDVVCDMRQQDIKNGGQGAPLIPLYHQALASDLPKPCAVLNIGGVANVTFLGAQGDVIGFDTGPGNAMIDDAMQQQHGKAFDEGGSMAAAEEVDDALIKEWLSNPYFDVVPPKSLDRNDFKIAGNIATLTAFTVEAIAKSCAHFPQEPAAWYITGGGRKNKTMMERLQEKLGVPVQPVEQAGWNGDAMEAEGFAYLAVRSLEGLPLTLPTTTGVKEPMQGGVQFTAGGSGDLRPAHAK